MEPVLFSDKAPLAGFCGCGELPADAPAARNDRPKGNLTRKGRAECASLTVTALISHMVLLQKQHLFGHYLIVGRQAIKVYAGGHLRTGIIPSVPIDSVTPGR